MNMLDILGYFIAAKDERAVCAARVRADTSDDQARRVYAEANEHVEALLIAHQHTLISTLEAVARSDWDVSPCGLCCRPVLCIPDGLPCRDECAKKESASPNESQT